MRVSLVALLVLLAGSGLGCLSNPPTGSGGPGSAADVKAVPVPAELAGKWRLEKQEGGTMRVIVYHITPNGYIEVDAQVKGPDRETRDRLTTAVTQIEGNKLTVTDISRTSADGLEEILPPERRRSRLVQFRVSGNELQWKRDNDSEWVLTRVKD